MAVPEWLQGMINTMQEKSDAKYESDLRIYRAAAQDWIAANVINRDNGLPVTAFTKSIPARVVFVADESNNIAQTGVVDSSIKPPELPPVTPKQAPAAFATGAPAQSAMLVQMALDIAEMKAGMKKLGWL